MRQAPTVSSRRASSLGRGALASTFALVLLAAALTPGLACKSAYYGLQESVFGSYKRDILVERVQDAREEQQETQKQFVSTYDRFKALTSVDGGEIKKRYDAIQESYDDCETQAQAVQEKIASVEEVAKDLFTEWKTEIGEISDADMRRADEAKLEATKKRYEGLLVAMKKASDSTKPVLRAFKDRVLVLKHDLNAQAIASLQNTAVSIQGDVQKLIDTMEASIREADEFLSSMKS